MDYSPSGWTTTKRHYTLQREKAPPLLQEVSSIIRPLLRLLHHTENELQSLKPLLAYGGNVMKLAVGIILLGLASVAISDASADVSGVALRFGGGCLSSNTSGSCVLKSTFSGFDLDTETAVLYTCSSAQGGYRQYSLRTHPVTAAGEAAMRIKNIPGGCFQVRSGPNGNNKPDARSRILCEK